MCSRPVIPDAAGGYIEFGIPTATVWIVDVASFVVTDMCTTEVEVLVPPAEELPIVEAPFVDAPVVVPPVVQWTVYFVEGADLAAGYGAIASELASDEPALVSAALVAGLGVPGALVEISAVAAVVR